jgi:aminopeptidase
VAEQFLDRSQVSAPLKEVRRKCVAQPVRVRDEPSECRGVEPPSTRREEERVLGAAGELWTRLAEVARDEARGLFSQRDEPILAALAEADVHGLLLEVDVAQIEPDRLRAAQPCRVDELDERLVSQRECSIAAEPIDEALNLTLLRCVGQPARALGRKGSIRNVLRPEHEPKERADRGQLSGDRGGREPAGGPRVTQFGHPVGEHADVHVLDRAVRTEPAAELAQIGPIDAAGPVADAGGGEEALCCGLEGHPVEFAASYRIACRMADRWTRLAELAVHGANIQTGQIVMVTAEIGQEETARAVAAAAYDRGAKFVDVDYFDPWVKRARIEHADPATLDFVPAWYGHRVVAHAEQGGGRVTLAGIVSPNALDGLDMGLVGKDMLPRVKELTRIVGDRLTNWCIAPAPHPDWARLVHPDLPEDEAYEKLWRELEHVLRLDEPDPVQAWEERIDVLNDSARRLAELRFDSIELRGPGTELTVGMLPSHTWWAADFTTADGLRHLPNLPTEEVFTTPDPLRTEGHVSSTKPLVLQDGTIIRGLRVRFQGGTAVEIGADENVEALRSQLALDAGSLRLGELALVDRQGRIGPLGTVFFNTLLDENAASHLAFGSGFPFLVDESDAGRVNEARTHVDFMVGSNELEVDGLTADGRRVPILRGGDWQI